MLIIIYVMPDIFQKSYARYMLEKLVSNYFLNVKVKSATVVKGDPKALFTIATTPRCSGGRYTFPWIAPITLDPYLIMLSVKQRQQVLFLISWAIGEHSTH